jgi:hypothetical protein
MYAGIVVSADRISQVPLRYDEGPRPFRTMQVVVREKAYSTVHSQPLVLRRRAPRKMFLKAGAWQKI